MSQELEALNAQIEEVQNQIVKLDTDLRVVESEYESFALEKQCFDTLRETCDALDKLGSLGADSLFWGKTDGSGHKKRIRERIATFEDETRGVLDRRQDLQGQIEQCNYQLDDLFEELWEARALEEERQEEFVIVREMSPMPYRPMLMPWSKNIESEKRFRRSLSVSMFWSLLLAILIHLVTVPIPDRTAMVVEIPARFAMLLKENPPVPIPQPIPKPEPEKKALETEPEKPAKTKTKPKTDKVVAKKKSQAKPGSGKKVIRKKLSNVGVLAFKSSFSDLMDEVPVASLARASRGKKPNARIPGQARVQRSLVAMQGKGGGGSRGISNFGVSRNLGNGGTGGGTGYGTAGQIGGVGTSKVHSAMAGLSEEAGRPLSDGVGPARTDEEIQIVFDRYKATLYRIYNRELRKDPTLRGKLLLKLTIEPSGVVSMCRKESTDLDSAELVKKIVARVKRFNFGKKEGVTKVTILYPIDFLPAG